MRYATTNNYFNRGGHRGKMETKGKRSTVTSKLIRQCDRSLERNPSTSRDKTTKGVNSGRCRNFVEGRTVNGDRRDFQASWGGRFGFESTAGEVEERSGGLYHTQGQHRLELQRVGYGCQTSTWSVDGSGMTRSGSLADVRVSRWPTGSVHRMTRWVGLPCSQD